MFIKSSSYFFKSLLSFRMLILNSLNIMIGQFFRPNLSILQNYCSVAFSGQFLSPSANFLSTFRRYETGHMNLSIVWSQWLFSKCWNSFTMNKTYEAKWRWTWNRNAVFHADSSPDLCSFLQSNFTILIRHNLTQKWHQNRPCKCSCTQWSSRQTSKDPSGHGQNCHTDNTDCKSMASTMRIAQCTINNQHVNWLRGIQMVQRIWGKNRTRNTIHRQI